MDTSEVRHPGERIKADIFPAKMSVTKAAELIGVGRPALSNLLNGKASLTADMAIRIETAFGFPRKDLLEMQAQYDAFKAKQKSVPTNAKTYAPPVPGNQGQRHRELGFAQHRCSQQVRCIPEDLGPFDRQWANRGEFPW
jgi:addiction module HigA family antidote